MNITIKPVEPEDKQKIRNLFNANKEIWPGGGGMIWYRFWISRNRTQFWDKAVDDEGNILGFVHWAIRMDGARSIYDILVKNGFRNKGIGRALIQHVGRPIILKSSEGNSAHEFYLKLGFEVGNGIVKTKQGNKPMLEYILHRDVAVPPPDGPWIMTFSGKKINPLNMCAADVSIMDIAHALSCTNRFAGHALKPISVAQHSWYVSKLCSGDEMSAKQALLHDGSEAYIGDVTHWVKQSEGFEAYRALEKRIQQTVYRAFKVPVEDLPLVKEMDKVTFTFEAPKAFGKCWDVQLPGYDPLSEEQVAAFGKWAIWPWRKAEEMFLSRYRMLFGC